MAMRRPSRSSFQCTAGYHSPHRRLSCFSYLTHEEPSRLPAAAMTAPAPSPPAVKSKNRGNRHLLCLINQIHHFPQPREDLPAEPIFSLASPTCSSPVMPNSFPDSLLLCSCYLPCYFALAAPEGLFGNHWKQWYFPLPG